MTAPSASAGGGPLPGAEILISSDSHVVEPRDLWRERLPAALGDPLAPLPVRRSDQPGATDPSERFAVMAKDDVSMEVLYPTYGLTQYGIEDAALQEACFRVYNDWIVEYCAATPGRLVAVPMIPAYDIVHAIAELERCTEMGLKGGMLWHVPPAGLEYSSGHYDRLWAAASEMDAPINLHILTGFSYTKGPLPEGIERFRTSVEVKLHDAVHVLFDFLFHGVLDRFPELKLVLVEFEVGWIPWLLQQWDYYVHRNANRYPLSSRLLPSELFERQVFASFINDWVGTTLISSGWGISNCMWSNDFPHGNTSWPRSRAVIERDLGGLDAPSRARLLTDNVAELYHLDVPAPIPAPVAD